MVDKVLLDEAEKGLIEAQEATLVAQKLAESLQSQLKDAKIREEEYVGSQMALNKRISELLAEQRAS